MIIALMAVKVISAHAGFFSRETMGERNFYTFYTVL